MAMADILDERPWDRLHRALGVTAPAPVERPLGEFVAEAARRIPDQAALFFEGRRIGYANLNALANRLANALAANGVRKGDVIALHLPTTPQFVAGLIAASKLGAVACGVSTLLSQRELRFQLADSEARALITLDALHENRLVGIEDFPPRLSLVIVTQLMDLVAPEDFTPTAIPATQTVRLLDFIAEGSTEFAQIPVSGDDIFLLQYTGGTTGKPKGALLSLRAVMTNPALANVYCPYVYGAERMASPFPLFHIGGVGGLVGALAAGAEYLLLANPRDIDKFVDHLAVLKPTRLGAIPTFYQLLLGHPRRGEIDFSHVKFAITGGAPITVADRARIDALIGGGKLADYFGMTETASVYLCSPPMHAKPQALGVPAPGVDVRIVDVETGRRTMPFGETGEIITSGVHVMKGYKGRKEETAHALRELDGKIWMYTGDVGAMDEDGFVYLRDRSKDMLIVGGFKVFSLEVEETVRELDFVAATALIGTPDFDRPGNDVVNLFIQTKAGVTTEQAQLSESVIAHCRAHLAPYKIPKKVHFVASLPLTNVGKINKLALRDLARDAIGVATDASGAA